MKTLRKLLPAILFLAVTAQINSQSLKQFNVTSQKGDGSIPVNTIKQGYGSLVFYSKIEGIKFIGGAYGIDSQSYDASRNRYIVIIPGTSPTRANASQVIRVVHPDFLEYRLTTPSLGPNEAAYYVIEGPKELPAVSNLKILTDPAGAIITFSGKDILPKQSPAYFEELVSGAYAIHIESTNDYLPIDTTLNIAPGENSLEVYLKRPMGTVSVSVIGDIQDYHLRIDDLTTPFSSVKDLPLTEGTHKIYFVSQKINSSKDVTVKRDTHHEVVFNFEKPLAVQIISSPSGAEVLINDRPVGKTPVKTNLLPGDYEIILMKPYHKTLIENLSIPGSSSMQEPLSYNLSREEFKLTIQSGSDAGTVYIDDNIIGVTNQEIKLAAGKIASFRIESPSVATYRKSVMMDRNKSVRISLYPKVALMIGGEVQYLPDQKSIGYGGNLGLSVNHFFIGFGAGIQKPRQEDFYIDVTHQNVIVNSNNYSQVGTSYTQDAMGIYMYGKAGLFTYKPFKLIVNAGFGYLIGPEFQLVYRADEDLISELFITLPEGDYFTQPQTIQHNSSYAIGGIMIPLFRNSIQLGFDVWFGNDKKKLYNAQLILPFGSN